MELKQIVKSGCWVTALGVGSLLAGCDGQDGPDTPARDTAVVQVALTSIPNDVACVRATVTGRERTVVRTQDVKPGLPASFTMEALPTGEVAFDMDAFAGSCPRGPKADTASWISDTQRLFLQGGVRTSVSVVLRPNGIVDVNADFVPDDVPPPPPVGLQFNPPAFDFGRVAVGGLATAQFKLFNPSMEFLPAPQVFVKGPSAFSISRNGCEKPLPPGAACDVALAFSPTYPSQLFFGSLIAITGSAFASAELSGSSAGGPPPPPSGLVGHWSFDGAMGPFVPDQSGFGNNGEVIEGPNPNGMPVPARIVSGKVGSALDLSGPQTWVRVRRSDSIDSTGETKTFTLAAWINPGQLALPDDFQQVISRNEASTNFQHFGLGLRGGVPTATVHFFFAGGADTVPAGQWNHIAATYDGITLTVFVNGTVTSSLDIGWPIASDTTNTIIGGTEAMDSVKQFFGGLVDEVRLYNTPLSADQIRDLTLNGM